MLRNEMLFYTTVLTSLIWSIFFTGVTFPALSFNRGIWDYENSTIVFLITFYNRSS